MASRSMPMEWQPTWKRKTRLSNLPERPRVRTLKHLIFSELFPHRCSGKYYRACPPPPQCLLQGLDELFLVLCDRLPGIHQAFHNHYLLLSLCCIISSACPYFISWSHFLLFQILIKNGLLFLLSFKSERFSQFNVTSKRVFGNTLQGDWSPFQEYCKATVKQTIWDRFQTA